MSRDEDVPQSDAAAGDVFEAVAGRLGDLRRIPVSTYRLQINFNFGFRQAREIVPYLDDLGITDLYLSPCFLTKRHSLHGYDILRPDELNPEAGTEQDYAEFSAELERRGMGQILDIVPNHLSIAGNENTWWADVLENGPSSSYADFFDIDWSPVDERHKNRIVLPILGDQYGRVLENQELTLDFAEGSFIVRCRDLSLPLDPRSYAQVLKHAIEGLEEAMGQDHPGLRELLSVITAIDNIPPFSETAPDKIAERGREKEIIKKRLFDLARESAEVSAFISRNLAVFNGVKGDARSFDLLDRLLDSQVYALCYWRVAGQEINYRRFFDINDLAAVKEENLGVFRAMHSLVFRLAREKRITGLRVDHLDGLYDPAEYFRRLQRGCFLGMCLREIGDRADRAFESAVEARYDERVAADPAGPLARPFYVIAEKVLLKGEDLRSDWAILGTNRLHLLERGQRDLRRPSKRQGDR